jgi:xanthine dehydrogenase accessory factor
MRIWTAIADFLARHGTCAMVSVIAVKGSAPREPGARLIIAENGLFRGTIGGGALEWRAIAEAQAALARGGGTFFIASSVLGPDLGQCCGGQVKLLTEIFLQTDRGWIEDFARLEERASFSTQAVLDGSKITRRIVDANPEGAIALRGNVLHELFGETPRPIYVFGAGHVGRALILALAPLPFAVKWIDSRPDAFPAAVPANAEVKLMPSPPAALMSAPQGSLVLVMTHSHALDFDIVLAALKRQSFAYVGLIGSETKRARFLSRLRAAGLTDAALRNFICPIGVPGIRSKLPAVIAASVAADLIGRDEQLRMAAHPLSAALRTA